MEKPTASELFASEIYDMIMDAFDPENEDAKWDLDKIDATAWFTGLVKASGVIFNKLTDDDKNGIEWTHISQNLLIQDMFEGKRGV